MHGQRAALLEHRYIYKIYNSVCVLLCYMYSNKLLVTTSDHSSVVSSTRMQSAT